MKNAIIVWKFDDAPEDLRNLSRNGGDEDWLAVVPAHMANEWIGWLEDPTPFGVCCIQEEILADGRKVVIGSHA